MQLEITEDERFFLIEATYQARKEMVEALSYLSELPTTQENIKNVEAKIKCVVEGIEAAKLLSKKLEEARE